MASPSDEDALEVRTRSGRISRPPSRLIEETGWSSSPTRSRSRCSLHPPRIQSVYRHPSPTPSITITESESNTTDTGRSPTQTFSTLAGTVQEKYIQYQNLQEERTYIKEKAREKWEETKEAARKEHTDLANRYTQEVDAVVKILKEFDIQLEETAYKQDKASLELNRYKLGIFRGTDQEEELENKIYLYQTRINEYEKEERPFQKDTEQFVASLKEEQEELLEELQEREIEEKKPTPVPGQFEESPKKPTIERKPSYQQHQKSADIKPEQLFKGKGKEIEEAQLPPPEKPKQQTTMASEKHDFKPPKPRTYSGKGKDKDPETFEQWKQEVLDYFDLTSMLPSKHIQALGYFVNDTARDYYHTKRRKHSDTNPVTIEEMLKGIKNHCIPTTSSNVYWKQWDQVSQIQHGKVQRIGVTAIEIDRIAE